MPQNEAVIGHVRPDPIMFLGSPILERPACEVTEFNPLLNDLVDRMFETMHAANGVGLAAPQIGHSLRICVIEVPGRDRLALVNPQIVHSEVEETDQEGCLSIPGFRETVTRAHAVIVEALSKRGHPIRIEGDGLFARALQHEIDHLNGVLFIKHLAPAREKVIRRQFWRAHR